MATPRAAWSGHLRLSLVSLGIRLYPATQGSVRVPLNQIHKPTGKRIRYEKVVPGIGKAKPDDIVRGYEYAKDKYVLLEPEEIDELKLSSSKALELTQFVDRDEIEPIYYDKPYFVAPSDEASEEAYVVLRDALKRTGKVGLGQVVIARRQSIAALRPCGDGLILETLRYADEVRSARGIFADLEAYEPHEEQIELAEELIKRKSRSFDAKAFEDAYAKALKELIDAKLEDRAPETEEVVASGGQVVDLMEALRKSVAAGRSRGGKNAGTKSGTRKRGSAKSTAKRPAAKRPASKRAKAGAG